MTGRGEAREIRIAGDGQAAFGPVRIGLYALANAGAHLAFVPLLQILVPLQAASIDPARAPLLLSRVALCGALAASVANILFGALSDRSGRRPWLAGGLAATMLTYAAIWRAATPLALVASVVAFQFAFNALFAPLGAMLADNVADTRKGLVSALLGLGYPVASIVGAQAVGALTASRGTRFIVLGLLVCAFILPFLWRVGGRPAPPRQAGGPLGLSFNPLAYADFARALAGRLLVVTALSLVELYLLLYLRSAAPGLLPVRLEAAYAQLIAIMTLANIVCALAAGYASDIWGRRSLFVFAGAAAMACGIAGMAISADWDWLRFSALVYGAGAGIHYAVDLALIVQLLPQLRDAGKDLGFVNLANTVPQVIAPVLAMMLLGGAAPAFRELFLVAAAAALLGGACVLGITTSGRKTLLFLKKKKQKDF